MKTRNCQRLMKPLYVLFMMLAGFSPLIFSSGVQAETNQKPSQINILATLSATKMKAYSMETLNISLKNTSSTDATVTVQRILSLGFHANQPLSILIEAGGKQYVNNGSVKISSIPSAVALRKLIPGEEYSLLFDLFRLLPVEVQAEKEIVIYVRYQDDTYIVESNRLTIELLPLTEDEENTIAFWLRHRYSGSIASTLAPLNALLKKHPNSYLNHRLLELKARLLFKTKPEEAFKIREQLVKSGKASYATRWRVFHVLNKQGRYREAIDVLSPVKEFGVKETIAAVKTKMMEQETVDVDPQDLPKEVIIKGQREDGERDGISGILSAIAVAIIGCVAFIYYRKHVRTNGEK
jgi:hypothetical protein